MGRLLSRWSWGLLMVLAGCGLSWPAMAQDLFDLPVGTVQNFGPNLQTTGGGRCRQPEGLAIDPDGNLYAASNSDQAITVGYVCVINNKGELVDMIAVPAGPGAGAVGLLGELWEDGYLIVLDQADNIQPHGRILRINPRTHEVKTIAAGLAFPNGMAEDRHGNIYVTDSFLGSIYRFSEGRSQLTLWFKHPALVSNNPNQPVGANDLALDADEHFLYVRGNLYVMSNISNEIQVFSPDGRLTQRYRGVCNNALDFNASAVFKGRLMFITNMSATDGGEGSTTASVRRTTRRNSGSSGTIFRNMSQTA